MRLTIVQLPPFAAKWLKLKLSDEDLQALEGALISNPQAGDVIAGTGGLRKLRFAAPSRRTGKRGGSRVVYAFINVNDVVYLFTLYDKSERADLTPAEKKNFRDVLTRLRAL